MGTAIYKRVSTSKQEEFGVSLETQQEKLEAYCTIKDFHDVKEYMDVGTGRNTERNDYQRMMKDVERGKISNVIVLRLDRLTRSVGDLDKLLKKFKKHNCALHSATESLDTSTANGRMMVNIIGIFAQWESETISERVTVNMQSLSDKGVWMSSVPFGFNLGEDKRLEINEAEANILKEAFDLVLEGNSFTAAEDIIRKKYSLEWSKNYLSRKLNQESIYGNIYRNGVVTKSTHPQIITDEVRWKLNEIRKNNLTGRKYIEHTDLFRRRVICEHCESIMHVNARSTDNYKNTNYSYVCDNCYSKSKKIISVSEKKIESAFMKYIDGLIVDEIIPGAGADGDKSILVNDLKRRLKTQNEKKDRIQRAWINGSIDEDDLETYKNEVDKEIATIEEELYMLVKKVSSVSPEELRDLRDYLNEHYNEFTNEEKRSFIQQHIKRIHYRREKVEGYTKRYVVTVENVEFF